MRTVPVAIVAILLLGAGSVPANAQFLEDFEERLWGAQFSFTPGWESVQLATNALNFDEFDLTGSDWTIGFTRGRMRSGHWGLSLVRQRWKEASICNGSECYEAAGSVGLRGFVANWFLPFGTPFAGDRLQAGMHVDLGGAWFEGDVRVTDVVADGAVVAPGQEVPVSDLLPEGWNSIPLPLVRVEAAVGVTVAPGLKVIGSGGYGFPFKRSFGISVAYFPMAAFD